MTSLVVRYLRPQWPKVLILAGLLLGGISLQLVGPQLLARFIDTARVGGAVQTLEHLALLFVCVAVLGQVLSAVAVYVSEDVGWTSTNHLRADLTRHCLQLDLPFHHAHTPGELIERIDGDVTQLATFFSQAVIRLLADALLLVGVFILLLRQDWRVGVGFTVFALGTLAALLRLRELAAPHWRQSRQASADLMGFLEERLAGTEDIRASGATEYVLTRLHQVMRALMQRTRIAGFMSSLMWGTTSGLFAVGRVLVFVLGAVLLRAGAMTLGTVYLLFHYLELLQQPLEQITRRMQDLQRANASLGRVEELFRLQSKTQDGAGRALRPGPLPVEFAKVSFSYGGDVPVLRDLTFRLEAGHVLGILGRTGSGKTTLGRLLVRLYDPERGVIRLGGVDIREMRLGELRSHVGVVTQDVQLLHATARENLTFFDGRNSDVRILEVLTCLGLTAWIDALPHGLETVIASGGGGLSAGEAQMLALARVFFKNPGLVILDEPSSRLDPATERLIEQASAQLLRDRTGIIIAHRLATVQQADDIMIIEDGQIREFGRRTELAANPTSHFATLVRTGLEEVLR